MFGVTLSLLIFSRIYLSTKFVDIVAFFRANLSLHSPIPHHRPRLRLDHATGHRTSRQEITGVLYLSA
ncbi:hypothetical protein RHMOL_Rhmol05G0041800 [Rhododendron molle]|uniref:Uncharacterized protein n=1 Tax=Rhododendron molle TaxID=49168 RepID=A0ACC0NMG7_RHOML|nr:hypothetical protein RHMOL_Rhmol05G0041800 [Rhododendron molle]